MTDMAGMISDFAKAVGKGGIEIYNEFSLQHELGIFLRENLPSKKVRFECNCHAFGNLQFDGKPVKKEIDISIVAGNKSAVSRDKSTIDCAIELKFPRNGQYPEQMFAFCRDVQFVEELKRAGCPKAFAVLFAGDHLFYSGDTGGIYRYFRGGEKLTGRIPKPTGKEAGHVQLAGEYHIEWVEIRAGSDTTDALKCAAVEADLKA